MGGFNPVGTPNTGYHPLGLVTTPQNTFRTKKQNEAECIEVELTTKLVLDKNSALNGLNSRWLTTKVHGNVDHASKMNVGTSLMMSNPRRDDCFRVVHDSREGTRDSPTWTLSKVQCFQLAGTKDQLRIVKLIRHLS